MKWSNDSLFKFGTLLSALFERFIQYNEQSSIAAMLIKATTLGLEPMFEKLLLETYFSFRY